MTDIAVRADNLGKFYRLGQLVGYSALGDTISNAFSSLFHHSHPTSKTGEADTEEPKVKHIWALKDVSFNIERGEAVGIIGRNGAGKTTLLRILSRITYPTEGRADVHGRVGSLLEVGTGFHPELTGRENIYLNGAILGMKKKELDRKFEEIVTFAGTEKFVDTPLKRYSSGMQVRLAFAVAAHLESEILLVDEVLAVGDIGFQNKCLGKMRNMIGGGRTVLFVSHNMGAIQQLCSKAILLENGRVAHVDDAYKCVQVYTKKFIEEADKDLAARDDRVGNGCMLFENVSVIDTNTGREGFIEAGNNAIFRFSIRVISRPETRENLVVRFSIVNTQSVCIAHCSNLITEEKLVASGDEFAVECEVNKLPLNTGLYTFSAYVGTINESFDYLVNIAGFQVVSGRYYDTGRLPEAGHSSTLLDYHWSLVGGN